MISRRQVRHREIKKKKSLFLLFPNFHILHISSAKTHFVNL